MLMAMRADLVVLGVVWYLWPTSNVRLKLVYIPVTPLRNNGPPMTAAVFHTLVGAHDSQDVPSKGKEEVQPKGMRFGRFRTKAASRWLS